ncbi:MAG: PAS domain S-box protein [Mariprofundus sp.]|nr:PAS domain S-box protein [Mariprofundus sp.]
MESENSVDFANLVIDTTPLAIIVVDRNGLIIRVNHNGLVLFGYQQEELLGEQMESLIAASQRYRYKFLRDNYINYEISYEKRMLKAVRKDGSEFPVELFLGSMVVKGELLVVLAMNDMSERKRMDERLQLSQKMEAVGSLAAGIAHEINTPLQYVGDNLKFLKDSFAQLHTLIYFYREIIKPQMLADEALKEKVTALEEEGDLAFLLTDIPLALAQSMDGIGKATTIVQALKTFAHPDEQAFTPIDINQLLENSIAISKNAWKHIAEIKLELAADLPKLLCLSEINQVFLNLIINAAQAIEERTDFQRAEKGVIKISTKRCGDLLEIIFTDNGVGIPASLINKVFDQFFTTKAVGKGTGQGLSISYNIVVRKLGGTIHIESEEGFGSSFIIQLPIRHGES